MGFLCRKQPPVCEGRLSHIAFIMDGNGRWAEKRGLPRSAGHAKGAQVFRSLLEWLEPTGVHYVTVYAFSTENWRRPKEEVDELMRLMDSYIDSFGKTAVEKKIRLRFIGDPTPLSPALREKMRRLESVTEGGALTVQVAFSYGGRDEIVHAVNRLLSEGVPSVTEKDISDRLYTAGIPDPDLIVRTGGEYRTSNFLPWQSAYAEYAFTDTLWPDLTRRELYGIIRSFFGRHRRYGGVQPAAPANK